MAFEDGVRIARRDRDQHVRRLAERLGDPDAGLDPVERERAEAVGGACDGIVDRSLRRKKCCTNDRC